MDTSDLRRHNTLHLGFPLDVHQRSGFCPQRILSCKKAGSVLREARDRVVSLVTDANAKVLSCHVSMFLVFCKKNNILLKNVFTLISLVGNVEKYLIKSSYAIIMEIS